MQCMSSLKVNRSCCMSLFMLHWSSGAAESLFCDSAKCLTIRGGELLRPRCTCAAPWVLWHCGIFLSAPSVFRQALSSLVLLTWFTLWLLLSLEASQHAYTHTHYIQLFPNIDYRFVRVVPFNGINLFV